MSSIEDALAEYITTLAVSSANCHQSEDRPKYISHLAAAAIMFAEYHKTKSTVKLKELVVGERRDYGWGFLAHDEGNKAESAFDKFAAMAESLKP